MMPNPIFFKLKKVPETYYNKTRKKDGTEKHQKKGGLSKCFLKRKKKRHR